MDEHDADADPDAKLRENEPVIIVKADTAMTPKRNDTGRMSVGRIHQSEDVDGAAYPTVVFEEYPPW